MGSPNSIKLIIPATIEELQGNVAGLVGVVKDLTTNVTQVTQTVGNMAEAVPALSDSISRHIIFPPERAFRFWNNSVLQLAEIFVVNS